MKISGLGITSPIVASTRNYAASREGAENLVMVLVGEVDSQHAAHLERIKTERVAHKGAHIGDCEIRRARAIAETTDARKCVILSGG